MGSLADQITSRRNALDLSLDELADRAFCSKSGLYRIVKSTDSKAPNGEMIYWLAVALGTTVGTLLGYTDTELPVFIPDVLWDFQKDAKVSRDVLLMLSRIMIDGVRPETVRDYQFIYEAICKSMPTKERSS